MRLRHGARHSRFERCAFSRLSPRLAHRSTSDDFQADQRGDRLAPRESSSPAPGDWRRAHEELSRLAKARARLDWQEGVALVSAERSGAHLQLGYATFAEYIGHLFGYTARWTAFRALRALGFREGETRRALEQVRSDPRGSGNTSTEEILRAALSRLSAATRQRPAGC